MQQHDERPSDPDQLVISSEGARGPDSLGPSRSLPARPPKAGHGPLAAIAGALAAIAGLALFALPPRATINARSLLKQTFAQLGHDGLTLENVQCPNELVLALDKPFTCSANARGVALKVQLTPAATREDGPIDMLRAQVAGAVGVADVTRAAAIRYAANAQVTCPHRLWLNAPGEREVCTMRVGDHSGPLTVVSSTTGGELALDASWIASR